jgi:hypothetical protein
MSSGPELAMVFRMRSPGGASEAMRRIPELARGSEGFDVSGACGGSLTLHRRSWEFLFETLGTFNERAGDAEDEILTVVTDMDFIYNDEGDEDPLFWESFSDVAEALSQWADPYFGTITDEETMGEYFERAELENPALLNYFSFDFIRDRVRDKERVIRRYATRTARNGLLVFPPTLADGVPDAFLREMGFIGEARSSYVSDD